MSKLTKPLGKDKLSPAGRLQLSEIWALLSLAPIAGPFALYYLCMRSFYSHIRELKAILQEAISLGEKLRSMGIEPPESPMLKAERCIKEIEEMVPRAAILLALGATFLDVLRIYILHVFINELEEYLGKKTRSANLVTLLLTSMFIISGYLRGALEQSGYWLYIMPSMSIVHLLWITAMASMIAGFYLPKNLLTIAILSQVFIESVIISLIHLKILNNVNLALEKDIEIMEEFENYIADLKNGLATMEDYEQLPPPPTQLGLCPLCKGMIPPIARYCPSCGTSLTSPIPFSRRIKTRL